jgi:cytochrome c oxidase assembly factor 1
MKQSKTPLFIGFGVLGLSAWGAFLLYAMNQERLSSSVVQQLISRLKIDPRVGSILGQSIRFEPQWWALGDPYISGAVRELPSAADSFPCLTPDKVNLLQGNVDVSFRIQGSEGDWVSLVISTAVI